MWIAAILACAPPEAAADAPLREPIPATDLDPDPDVLEVDLVAREADVDVVDAGPSDLWTWVDPWGGAPAMPGPLLDLRGAGRLVIHLSNELPESTTLHVHGLRLPASEDGTPDTQLVLLPGETWDYAIDVVDEGLAWYHPHVDSPLQVERGLYAPIRAQGGDPLPVTADRVIVLDDLRLRDDGTFDPEITADDLYSGRTSDLLLVNGAPAGTGTIHAGTRERWRLLNAATARAFRVDLGPGGATVIAHEGGTLASPVEAREILLQPGDRVEVVRDVAAGERFEVRALPYDRGYGPDPMDPTVLFAVDGVGGPSFGALPARAGRAPLEAPDAIPRELHLQRIDDQHYAIDGQLWPFNAHLDATLGSRERWTLVNETTADVPFHLHGTFFQLEAVDGAATPPSWEDVVTVPPLGRTEILIPFDAEGAWMLHTHVLEQAEAGMMGMIHVAPAAP